MDLILALLGVLIASGGGYYVVRLDHGSVSRALRLALWCIIGGLALYTAYALRLPGATWLREQSGVWTAGGIALVGGAVPLAIAWIAGRWRRLAKQFDIGG